MPVTCLERGKIARTLCDWFWFCFSLIQIWREKFEPVTKRSNGNRSDFRQWIQICFKKQTLQCNYLHIFIYCYFLFFYTVHFLPKDRLVPEIGKAVFGEDRERSFKDVVACFEQLGQERLAKILVVFFPFTSFGLRQFLLARIVFKYQEQCFTSNILVKFGI